MVSAVLPPQRQHPQRRLVDLPGLKLTHAGEGAVALVHPLAVAGGAGHVAVDGDGVGAQRSPLARVGDPGVDADGRHAQPGRDVVRAAVIADE